MIKWVKRLFAGLAAVFALFLLAVVLWPEKDYVPHEPSAEFRAEALAYNFPAMPDDWQDNRLIAADGTSLYWGQTGNYASAKATVVLVTDFKSSLLMKADEIAFMLARGYHVIGLDQRGQGRSGRHRPQHPEKLYAEDYSVYAEDLAQLITTLNLPESKPLLMTGNSFGAATITRTVGEFSELGVDGVMVLVPAYRPKLTPFSYNQGKAVTGFLRLFGKSEFFTPGQDVWSPYMPTMTEPTDCSSNPSRLYLTEALNIRYPEQRVGGGTVQWIAELMENGEVITQPDFASGLTLPIEMVVASDDNYIDTEFAANACTEAFPNCSLTQIPDTGHCITMESDAVLTQIYDRLDRLYGTVSAQK